MNGHNEITGQADADELIIDVLRESTEERAYDRCMSNVLEAFNKRMESERRANPGLVIAAAHAEAVKRARRRIRTGLNESLGKLAERYRANEAWLFLPDEKGNLQAKITYHTNLKGVTIGHSEISVVADVAKSKNAMCVPDVKRTERYLKLVQETQSEVAAAIVTPDDEGRLLGVVNLEAREANRFTEGSEQELLTDAKELIVYLLCLKLCKPGDLTVWPWHPDGRGRWSIKKILGDICRELTWDEKEDRCSSAIWYADRKKESMFVLGNSGYDYDFIAPEKMLPMESMLGKCADLPPGKWRVGAPEADADFLVLEKAKKLGLELYVAAPLHAVSKTSVGAWCVYRFGDDDERALPEGEAMAEVGKTLGEMIENFQSSRREVGKAYLDWKMARNLASSVAPSYAITLKQVLCEVLEADGCSIFAPNETQDRLFCLDTTAIKMKIRGFDGQIVAVAVHPANSRSFEYNLNDPRDQGLMWYLYRHPGVCLRLHSVLKLDEEQGLPEDEEMPQKIVERNMEYLERDTDDRRFLGLALTDREGEVVAVVRVVRSADSPPFTEWDERLLRALGEMCKYRNYWKEEASSAVSSG